MEYLKLFKSFWRFIRLINNFRIVTLASSWAKQVQNLANQFSDIENNIRTGKYGDQSDPIQSIANDLKRTNGATHSLWDQMKKELTEEDDPSTEGGDFMKNLKQVIIYGVLIWIVAFIVASAVLVVFKVTDAVVINVVTGITLLIFSIYFSKKIRVSEVKNGLVIAVIWFVLLVILDLIVTVRFTNFGLFTNWKYWFSGIERVYERDREIGLFAHWTYWFSHILVILPLIVMPLKSRKGGTQGASTLGQPEKT